MSEDEDKSNLQRVRVLVRPRPVEPLERDEDARRLGENFVNGQVRLFEAKKEVQVVQRRDLPNGKGRKIVPEDVWRFRFDRVFEEKATQKAVFDALMPSLISDAIDGYNATVMAYGQTGAGKTHTVMGKDGSPHFRGLIPRTISALFKELSNFGREKLLISISYLEIYNERLHDLLTGKEISSRILQDENSSTYSPDLKRKRVVTEEEALELLFEGESNRTIGSHEMNRNSTRSHCVFTFHLEKTSAEGGTTLSKLHLVDLAGSERVVKTNSTGKVFQEACSINKSLSFLEQVVVALGEKNRDHIPYRQSPLTMFLKDSLGGNSKSVLLACIWPSECHLDQTLATMRFATRMLRVKNVPVRNHKLHDDQILDDLKRQVEMLKSQLQTSTSIPTQFIDQNSASSIDVFLRTGNIDDLSIESMENAKQMFLEIRRRIVKQNKGAILTSSFPENITCTADRAETVENQETEDEKTTEKLLKPREELFEEFKLDEEGPGPKLLDSLEHSKASLMELGQRSKEVRVEINPCKARIDVMMEELKENEKTGKGSILLSLKAEKQVYKEKFALLTETRSEISYASACVKSCREKLTSEFETWLQNFHPSS